jgi:hypothetical protein
MCNPVRAPSMIKITHLSCVLPHTSGRQELQLLKMQRLPPFLAIPHGGLVRQFSLHAGCSGGPWGVAGCASAVQAMAMHIASTSMRND